MDRNDVGFTFRSDSHVFNDLLNRFFFVADRVDLFDNVNRRPKGLFDRIKCGVGLFFFYARQGFFAQDDRGSEFLDHAGDDAAAGNDVQHGFNFVFSIGLLNRDPLSGGRGRIQPRVLATDFDPNFSF